MKRGVKRRLVVVVVMIILLSLILLAFNWGKITGKSISTIPNLNCVGNLAPCSQISLTACRVFSPYCSLIPDPANNRPYQCYGSSASTSCYLLTNQQCVKAQQSNLGCKLTLVASYDFEATGTNILDTSGNNLNCVIKGTGVGDFNDPLRTGINEKSFIGGGYLNCGSSTKFDLNQVTISAWMKPSTLHRGTVVGKGNLWSLGTAANGRFETYITNTTAGKTSIIVNPAPATCFYKANEWTHVAMSVGNGKIIFYVNGIECGRSSYTGDLATNTKPVTIGLRYDTSNTYFNGLIDDVRVYNTVLSDAEIKGIAGVVSPIKISIQTTKSSYSKGEQIKLA
jgi:hypothetical protein